MVLDANAVKAIELVAETTFGTFPTDPTMLGFGGYVDKATVKKSTKTDKFSYLKGTEGTNRSQATKTVKVGEAYAASIDLRQTGWDIWKYVLGGGTIATPAIGDTVEDLSFGTKIGSAEYETLTGFTPQKIECSIEPEKTAVSTVEFLGAAGGGIVASDYIGAGAHAADPSGAALEYDGLSAVTLDAAALSAADAKLEYIKLGCEYPISPVFDATSALPSRIGGWSRGQRNIYAEIGLSLDALTTINTDFLDGAAHTFEFTALAKTLTLSNMTWEGDFEQALDPEDLIAIPLKASNIDLVFT